MNGSDSAEYPKPKPPQVRVGRARIPRDSVCTRPHPSNPYDWRAYSHSGIDAGQEVVALVDSYNLMPNDEDLLVAKFENRINRAAKGQLSAAERRPGDLDIPEIYPITSHPDMWEQRIDMTPYAAGLWRIYHSERWASDCKLILLLTHEKQTSGLTKDEIRTKQQDKIDNAVQRHMTLEAVGLVDATVFLAPL